MNDTPIFMNHFRKPSFARRGSKSAKKSDSEVAEVLPPVNDAQSKATVSGVEAKVEVEAVVANQGNDEPSNTVDVGVTYARQNDIPKLPIPSLDDTCERYLEVVEPLLTPDEMATTREVLENFRTGEGLDLQRRLQEYAASETSYIESFWDKAYLTTEGSVVLNLNPFFVLAEDPTPERNSQIARATSLTLSMLKFCYMLRREILPPDMWRGKPLCMSQYQKLFGSARVPHHAEDGLVTNRESRHIAVMSRGQVYHFDVLWPDGALAISEPDIRRNLEAIMHDSAQLDAETRLSHAVGVMTTERRSEWARVRTMLCSDALPEEGGQKNAESLAVIDGALFVLCLDDANPEHGADLSRNMLHGSYELIDEVQVGSCFNRWYDKLQLVVCANGSAGINFEHTGVDGHTVLRLASDVFTDTIIRFAQTITGALPSYFDAVVHSASASATARRRSMTSDTRDSLAAKQRPDTGAKRLEWVLSPALLRALHLAETRIGDLVLQNETAVLEFTGYGKRRIVSWNLSPDAFVQMAMLAAYFQLYGTVPAVYESVQTKGFLHGRTESCRSSSMAAVALMRCYAEMTFDPVPDHRQKLIQSLRRAVAAHVKQIKRCAVGQGVDRHLYALQCLARKLREEGSGVSEPQLFSDASWARLNHTQLSTSNCGNPALRFFGFGPVVADGFGVGYIIKDDGVSLCISSRHRQTARYCSTIRTYLERVSSAFAEEEANLAQYGAGNGAHRGAAGFGHTGDGYGFFDAGPVAVPDTAASESRAVGRRLQLDVPARTHSVGLQPPDLSSSPGGASAHANGGVGKKKTMVGGAGAKSRYAS